MTIYDDPAHKGAQITKVEQVVDLADIGWHVWNERHQSTVPAKVLVKELGIRVLVGLIRLGHLYEYQPPEKHA